MISGHKLDDSSQASEIHLESCLTLALPSHFPGFLVLFLGGIPLDVELKQQESVSPSRLGVLWGDLLESSIPSGYVKIAMENGYL